MHEGTASKKESLRSVNCSPTLTSSLAHAPNSSSEHDEASSESPVLFSPTPTHSIIENKWPSPPPLPQRSPRIRRRHNLHNYTSLVPTNGSCDVCSSVGARPPDTPTSYYRADGDHPLMYKMKLLYW